jgi:Flp pilus assembly secretin CpaC
MVFRFRPMRSPHGLILATVVATGSLLPALAANPDVEVLIDQATMLQLERSAAEVVVGNPSIADVAVRNSKMLVLTGKSFGETNLIVLDAEGKVIINRRVVVQEPRGGYVTVYRGGARETLHCSPNCETPLVIGDAKEHFKTIATEIRTKQSIGQTAAEGDKQSE